VVEGSRVSGVFGGVEEEQSIWQGGANYLVRRSKVSGKEEQSLW
jgi:hypothetical protein